MTACIGLGRVGSGHTKWTHGQLCSTLTTRLVVLVLYIAGMRTSGLSEAFIYIARDATRLRLSLAVISHTSVLRLNVETIGPIIE